MITYDESSFHEQEYCLEKYEADTKHECEDDIGNIFERLKIVTMNLKQEKRLCKVTSIIFVVDTLWKNIQYFQIDIFCFCLFI